MILASRKYPSKEAFVNDFLKTLTPGVIPNEKFIKWDLIDQKTESLKPILDLYVRLKNYSHDSNSAINELADSLLSADDPLPYILCGFELLGHTDKEIATMQNYSVFRDTSSKIKGGDQFEAEKISRLIFDLGMANVLKRDDLGDLLFGIQIGLETHRRKNVCGSCFNNEIKTLLGEVCAEVSLQSGKQVDLKDEVSISFIHGGESMSKTVDFGIIVDGVVRFGVEVNFYSSSGSKPTEIKRSYGNILQELESVGINLVWITDGKGYFRMKKSLGDAFAIVPNIYNYRQAKHSLSSDIIAAIR